MALIRWLCDVKVWVFSAIILALLFGFDHPSSADLMVIVLIVQMTLALDGLVFSRGDLKTYSKDMALSLIACFMVNTILTLAIGSFFIGDTDLWYGWVMLASVPCAVSVITAALYMRGDVKLAMMGLTIVYIASLAVTPLMTYFLLGEAVNPLELFKYIVLFIAIPFGLCIPLRKLRLPHTPKVIGINIFMFLMVFIALGSRRDYMFSDPGVVMWILVASFVRVFVFGFLMMFLLSRIKVTRDRGITFLMMSCWKNSGLSVSLCIIILGISHPQAVLPCAISLVVESVWFAVATGLVDRIWPVIREPSQS